MISLSVMERWSESLTLTRNVPCAAPPSSAAACAPSPVAPLVVTPLLLTRMVAPHLRHLILTVFPWTFSSETVYLDWQVWQVIFMWRGGGWGERVTRRRDCTTTAIGCAPFLTFLSR